MAFNFNWSPLTADEEFYRRARDLLTTALNKSPKPPIIVDDILVNELNLGSVPPELEILEIGDLAEDRFRGIFKMCYSGDAYLTLRTRVQANPLNTYLSSKPTFTSPQPLAAADGLTIPLSITLSEIRLSAFIILVFSKQKGLTLVFRNDPLESLKVSSTFDSIQFVRDYLQRTIEGQLRNLMMDELPAIIHRLSVQLWCKDQQPSKDNDTSTEKPDDETAINPFANMPTDAVDPSGRVLEPSEIASLSSDGGTEVQSLFAQRNLLRLAALTDSHRTLSLFTPGIRNAVFRAWTGAMDQGVTGYSTPLPTPSLLRTQSLHGSSNTYTFTDTGSVDQGSLPSRPSLTSMQSQPSGLALASGRHPRNSRKKKTRVVNLRRKVGSETSSEVADTASDVTSVAGPSSEPIMQTSIPEEAEEESQPAPLAPSGRLRFRADRRDVPARQPLNMDIYEDPNAPEENPTMAEEKSEVPVPSSSKGPLVHDAPRGASSDSSSVILEQAWIMKMAGEIAHRIYDEKQQREKGWSEERDDMPPPAYQATQ